MRWVLLILALLGTIAVVAVPAGAVGEPSGVRGVVLDTTCYGPCQAGQEPQPYQGSGLTVVVRRVSTGEVLRRLTPEHGRFSTRLGPGGYRVVAKVKGDCWDGESKRVGIRAHEFTRVELHVGNGCIL